MGGASRRPPRVCRPSSVRVEALDLRGAFGAGEGLRTGISAKFTRARLEGDLQAAGLQLEQWFEHPEGLFALALAGRAT